MNLLHSEWIKLSDPHDLGDVGRCICRARATLRGLLVGLASFSDIGEIDEVITGLGLLMTLMLVLGVLIITTEFRHGTSSSTFLVSPRRWPVMIAKLVAAMLIALVAGLLFVLVNGGLALPIYSSRGGTLPPTSDLVSLRRHHRLLHNCSAPPPASGTGVHNRQRDHRRDRRLLHGLRPARTGTQPISESRPARGPSAFTGVST
jgi:hypothetical protein